MGKKYLTMGELRRLPVPDSYPVVVMDYPRSISENKDYVWAPGEINFCRLHEDNSVDLPEGANDCVRMNAIILKGSSDV